MYEERREVVTGAPETTEVHRETVERPARRVVEESAPTYVQRHDPVGNTVAANSMITTIVWAIVVIALLIVGILVLVHYGII